MSMIAGLAFYAFAAVLIASAVMVVTSRNPVHSVLFLILAFFNAAALFLIAGAEFLAMILVIVYVGAVAVLFLFVVMMLDVDFSQLREGFQRYAPIGAVVGGILFLELILVLGAWQFSGGAEALRLNPTPAGMTNTQALGHILYTDYIYLFQAAGMVLLVAMIGAIVLTHRDRVSTRRQDIAAQVARAEKVELQSVPTGVGLKDLGILRRLPPEPKDKPKEVAHHGHGHDDDHGHGGHH
ncbi:NADH-quinone oxidoreductase subunit J [Roseomonas sp. OT10]|nr:NADH-quinone oxidoreductase subunit J [Roseomonas sp. OT10]UFN50071.1 NADH-quinone oxidoreductase subunit J [Roseomonas sp. OT10]